MVEWTRVTFKWISYWKYFLIKSPVFSVQHFILSPSVKWLFSTFYWWDWGVQMGLFSTFYWWDWGVQMGLFSTFYWWDWGVQMGLFSTFIDEIEGYRWDCFSSLNIGERGFRTSVHFEWTHRLTKAKIMI